MSSVEEPYVVAFGAVCVDEYYTADEWVNEGNKLLVRHTDDKVGGMIPNAACVFSSLGVKTYFCDSMNTSPVSKYLLEDLKSYGLDVSQVAFDDTLPDTKCIIVLTGGERTILVIDPSKPKLKLEGARLELFRNAAYVYTSCSEFARIDSWEQVAADLKAHGAKLVFDVEATTLEDERMLRCASVLFFNQEGFERFCNGRDKEEVIQSLFSTGTQILTITMGAEGSYTRTKDQACRVSGRKVKAVDTTGAGDTYNSSFVRCLIKGMSIEASAKFANAAASYAITQMGPKGGAVSAAFVERYMNTESE